MSDFMDIEFFSLPMVLRVPLGYDKEWFTQCQSRAYP